MRAAASDAEAREKVVRLVVLGMRLPSGEPARNLVQLDDHGACPMLDPDGACGVQRQHGEALLSTTCSVFPRTSLAVEGRLEVTGSLACPELARLSLLAEDGLDQDSPLAPVLPRAYVGKSVETEGADLYTSSFTRTRGAVAGLFRQEQFSVGARFARWRPSSTTSSVATPARCGRPRRCCCAAAWR
jgi:lysine-N-methylase